MFCGKIISNRHCIHTLFCHACGIVGMRIKSEDILKPGAKMVVTEIDFNDPEIKKLFADTKRRQHKLKLMCGWRYEGWWRKY